MNIESELSKKATKDDEVKDLKQKTEKHDHKNKSKTLKIDNDYFRREQKSLKNKKVFLKITEIMLGSASTISFDTLAKLNRSADFIISRNTAL